MSKIKKTISVLLVFVLVAQLFGLSAPEVFADDAADASAVAWSVSAKDDEGHELMFSSAEEVEAALGKGFSVDFGKDASGAALTAPTVADLRRSGVRLTPPAGYALRSVLLVAEGCEAAADSRSLLSLAQADPRTAGAVLLPASIFAEDFDASSVGTVFNGSGERYLLRLALDRIDLTAPIHVQYSAGALSTLPSPIAAGGDDVTLSEAEGQASVSYTAASPDAQAESTALNSLGKKFVGWKLLFANGASALVQGGDTLNLASSVSLEAQWKDAVVFAFESGEKLYDGTPLTVSYSRGGEVKSGDTLTIPDGAFTLSRTDAGESAATLDVSQVRITRGEEDVTGEYEIVVLPGTLRIVPRSVTFTVENVSGEYNAQPLTPSSYIISAGDLVDGHTATAAYAGEQTVPGTSTASARFSISDAEGRDVTGNYNISVINGSITVTERSEKQPLTVKVADAEKEYDGSPLDSSTYTISDGALLGTDQLVLNAFEGGITDVGEGELSASFAVKNGETDVSSNYAITVLPGKVVITPPVTPEPTPEPTPAAKIPLTVKVKDAEKPYDGTALNASGYEITSGALLQGDKLVLVSYNGSLTGVGTAAIGASFAVSRGTTDVSELYDITVVPGKLTISHRSLVLTADSASKEFDGKELVKNSYAITSGSLVSGHTLTLSITGSQTKIGSSANAIDPKSVKVTDADGKNVTAQYSIALREGTLSVTAPASANALTVTVKSAEKVYDGTPLSVKDYEITSGKLAEGDELVPGTFSGELTNAGEAEVKADFTVKNGDTDVSGKYSITIVPGKLTVKPRPITITAASASKVYDGSALTRSSYSVTSGELVKGHTLKANVVGSQLNPGSSANSISKNSIKITDASGADVTANYAVTTAAGTLTVSSRVVNEITLSVGDRSKIYDGQAKRFTAADVSVIAGGPLPVGYTIEASFNPESVSDVGKYDVTIKSVTIRNASGADVTGQYNITRAKGSYTITERQLVIETKAANKVYDGTPLTERSTPNITGRVESHQVTLRITGSQTKVGSSENTVADVKITDKNTGADVTKNYDIRYQYGLLTVSDEAGTGSDGPVWVGGSSGTLFFKLDHDYEGFEGLQIDGKDIDRDAYTSASGSTEIWLKASFLNTLPDGSHTLTAKYSGGETVNTGFSIEGTQSTQSVRRGQSGIWIIVMLLALLGCLCAAYFLVFGSGKGRRWKRPSFRSNGTERR